MRLGGVLLLATCLLLAGCTLPPPPSTSSPAPMGGVRGMAWLGPTCPVQQDPPKPGCEDRPYVGNLSLIDAVSSKTRLTFRTGSDGRFEVAAAPGEYWIRNPPGQSSPPTCSTNQTVAVHADAYTSATVYCDTGIRL